MTTPPVWDGDDLTMVDLDLDVILLRDERGLVLDDQDEFEQHQVELGYPPEIISLAEDSADRVWAAIAAGEAPYDGTADHWLTALTTRPHP
jgi:protein associated with RNAse G/E